MRKVAGNYRIVIDNTSKVVNASASTFRDLWKVDNTEYEEDSCYTTTESKTVQLNASVKLEKVRYRPKSGGQWIYVTNRSRAMLDGIRLH